MNNKIQITLADFDAFIFDMDGTMINNMNYHKKAWMEFAKKHGQNFSEEEFKEKFSGKKNDKIFQLIFNNKLTVDEVAEFTEEKEEIYRKLYAPDITEVPGLTNIIKILHKNHKKLAVATTAPEKNREFGLSALHLIDSFDVILGDEDVTKGKPDPEIYLKTASQLGVSEKKCLVFEDSPPGVAAGRNAYMTVIGLLTTHSKEDLKDAKYCITDFTNLTFV
jgi:beta-phosphoglucomutase